jgi:hypothetical protein
MVTLAVATFPLDGPASVGPTGIAVIAGLSSSSLESECAMASRSHPPMAPTESKAGVSVAWREL